MAIDPTAFDLIVFDWDGTLMDSEARIVTSMRDAFAFLGCAPPSPEAVREVIGLGLDEAISRLPGAGRAVSVPAVVEAYRARYLDTEGTPTPLFDGAAALVQALHRRGHRLAVATGKSRRGLDRGLRETGLGALFHATRCADESFSKPHPGMLLELMDELGADPKRTLMIGDTEYDLQMAANAGVQAVAVTYGTHDAERLRALAPLACLDSVAALQRWLLPEMP